MNIANILLDKSKEPATHDQLTRVTITLAPAEVDMVGDRCLAYNIGPSRLFKLLREVERRHGLLRREVSARLKAPATASSRTGK